MKQVQMEYRETDIEKDHELKFLSEEIEEFTSR